MKRTTKRRTLGMLIAALTIAMLAPHKASAASYYKTAPFLLPAPQVNGKKKWTIQNFGPVGIGIDLVKPNFTMVISNVEKGSPAEATGKLKKGQVIESINGRTLKDRDPREILGEIITEAEAKDGKVQLVIKDAGEVTVTIPVMGAYSETWPLDCAKSDNIVKKMAALLRKQEKPKWGSVLFLLSTGEEEDLNVVRKWMKGIETIGPYPWHKGYEGIGLCEYYLRTGDQTVLPVIKKMTEELRVLQYNGAWSGRGHAFFKYMGGGHMNAAGVHCLTFLLLSRYCGVEVDDAMLQCALRHFYRFAGYGLVAYGDHTPEGGFRDNGKTGGLAVAMAAATLLTPEGESSIYAKARDVSAMKNFYGTNWFHAGHTGGGIGEIWHHAGMSLMHERRSLQYRSYLDSRRWVMELSRRHTGAIGIAGYEGYDMSATDGKMAWGTFFALTYTLPRRKLQLFGAPRSQWAKAYQLPKRPWGNAADEDFVSPKPIPHPALSVADMEKETAYNNCHLRALERLGAPGVTEQTMLKYVHHPELCYRTDATSAMAKQGRADLILMLLKSQSPRLRYAGLGGILGGRKLHALPPAKVTEEMRALVGKMVDDPAESWWVRQTAIMVLKRGGAEAIARHKKALLELARHEEWWVQNAALDALALIAADPAHYKDILPVAADVLRTTTRLSLFGRFKDIYGRLNKAPAKVQELAFKTAKEIHQNMPADLKSRSDLYVIPMGASLKRLSIESAIGQLPQGEEYLKYRPLETLASSKSEDEKDTYRFDPRKKPDGQFVGTWHLQASFNGFEVDNLARKVQNAEKGRKNKARNLAKRAEHEKKRGSKRGYSKYSRMAKNLLSNQTMIELHPDGSISAMNGGRKKKAPELWQEDMMLDAVNGKAKKMRIVKQAGVSYLLVERPDWKGYDLYTFKSGSAG